MDAGNIISFIIAAIVIVVIIGLIVTNIRIVPQEIGRAHV